MLKCVDLVAGYGQNRVLKEVSLRVEPGQIVALIGANGAGKSTTLRSISGMIRPESGRIVLSGVEIQGLPAHRLVPLGLAHVPEGRAILARMSVQENLELGAFTRRDPDLAADLDLVYELFPRLAERRRQPAGSLSGGEQQMLAIGRALMSRPKLLLLDEPSMGLSPVLVSLVFDMIQEVNRRGASILLVEQNARQALRVAHYGYVLEMGRIVLEGPAPALLNDESVSAAYLGSS